jgi:hypothetical protein
MCSGLGVEDLDISDNDLQEAFAEASFTTPDGSVRSDRLEVNPSQRVSLATRQSQQSAQCHRDKIGILMSRTCSFASCHLLLSSFILFYLPSYFYHLLSTILV